MTSRTPVTLISGYLGAGKTTLVNALLRKADGRRLAVLVNDFGALPIDADLIEARDGNLINISGGCVCCSFGSDLIAAIMQLRSGGRPIDHLLIETSGVALPASIAQSLQLIGDLDLHGIVGLADAETIRERATDRYMGDTVLAQLAASDIVVLNKIDLASPERISAAADWLKQVAPRARILPAHYADLPADLILASHDTPPAGRFFAGGHDSGSLVAVNLEVAGNGDPEAFAQALADVSLRLLRAKGLVYDRHGTLVAVHVMGQRVSVDPAPAGTSGSGRLVCIGLAHEIEVNAVLTRIASCPPFSAKIL